MPFKPMNERAQQNEPNRFRVVPPAPAIGLCGWGVFDEELGGVLAFTLAEAPAKRIAASLNAQYALVPALRGALTGKP